MLVLSLLWAWTAWNLYRPRRSKPEFLTILSYFAGALVGELALHFVAAEVLITLLIIILWGLDGLSDALGLLIALGSWAAIIAFYLRSDRCEQVLNNALRRALALAQDAPLPDTAVVTHRPAWRRLLHPFRFDNPGVIRHHNVIYHRQGETDLHLDIYLSTQKPQAAPVLIQIHGGAWQEKMGAKEHQGRPLMNQLVENGWICVAVQYRLSPTATFPDHIIDCKRALCWVKDHIAEYGGDPDFIAVTGGSAGGHLSSLLALSADARPFQPGFEERDTRVQACVPLYGFYDFFDRKGEHVNTAFYQWVFKRLFKQTRHEAQELWETACPAVWASDEAPPFFVLHGACDTLVPASEARNFVEALDQVTRQPVAYAEIPDAQHAFDVPLSRRTQLVVNYLCIYLCELHRRHCNAVETEAPTLAD